MAWSIRPGIAVANSVRALASDIGSSVNSELTQWLVVSLGDHDHDRVRLQPARHEGQNLYRRPIKPLSIVDEAEHRLGFGKSGEEGMQPEADQEAVPRRAGPQSDGRFESLTLGGGHSPEAVIDGRAQQLQSGVRKIHLRCDALCTNDLIARRLSSRVVEERALADARLAAQYQRRAVASPPTREQLIEHGLLSRAADQLPSGLGPAGIRTHVVDVHSDSLAATSGKRTRERHRFHPGR
jgi:hypothetical protein